jgi:uncharacterized protein (TIGR02145 family)
MKKLLLITATVFYIQICNSQTGTVTDIDGNVYNTVTIGTQKWMKENLRTTKYSDGTAIPLVNNVASWDALSTTSKAYCWYNDDIANQTTYGALYTWAAAMNGTASTSANPSNAKGVCPTGWHLPSNEEWAQLTTFLGGENLAGGKLKETGTTHWGSPNTGATNETGFTALPDGGRFDDGTFASLENYGNWWSATESSTSNAWSRFMLHNLSNADRSNDYKALGFSVRCIEDPIPDSAKYLGQTPPGNKAVKFAPGIISKPGRMEYKVAFSPDGKECFINVGEGTGYKVYSTKRVNNTWTEQTVASFSANQSTEFSSFSVDGNKVFFDINEDIWMSERTNTGWNEAQKLSSPVNTSSHESGYSETVDGTMYFTSDRPGSITSPIYKNLDIWTINKTTNQAENIGNIINSSTWDVTPCIAPDGSYLIYTKGDGTTMDLFISFKKEDSSWTTPLNMDKSGTKINVINQNSPSLSPDGKYLFFNRHDQDSADIYWVSTSIIDTLKKNAIPTGLINKTIDEKVKLYPNPISGQFTISFGPNPVEESHVTISNLQGMQVFSKIFKNVASDTIDLTGHPTGIYMVKVVTDGVSYEKKILKE